MDDIICYYINLDKDTERKTHIEQQLSSVFSKDQLVRIKGIVHTKPYVGCSISHINCLKEFMKTNKEYCIIFEDDFEFEIEPEEVKNAISQAIANRTKLFLLSYHSLVILLYLDTRNGYLCKFTNGQMACAYMVSKQFAPLLLKNFEESKDLLDSTNQYGLYALDQYWKKTHTEEGVYACTPRLGKQKSFYSNIEHKSVDYQGSFMITVIPDKKDENNMEWIIDTLIRMEESPIQAKLFLTNNGNNNIINNYIVYLDETESYYDKVIKAFEWVINNKKNMDYIYKSNDICNINYNETLLFFKQCNIHKIPYFGKSVKNIVVKDETTKIIMNYNYLENSYFLNKNLIQYFDKDDIRYIFGDDKVGYKLYSIGIKPISLQQS
jgi:GR25 family glycosyltransferase involved in LPS biosynthesis